MKVKAKVISAIMGIMLLVSLAFGVFRVRAASYIKIGVIGPVGWPQMDGMVEGATLAAEWINGPGGGIVIGGTRYDVQIVTADEHAADMRPDLGAAEMERLCDPTQENVDFVLGGFRTECVRPIREVAVRYNKLHFIAGAATNDLIDCGYGTPTGPPTPCGKCVRCDYTKYKYMFRVTPINDTMLLYNILGFLSGYVLPYRLAPLYGSPVNTAVIAEDLSWTVRMYDMLVPGPYPKPLPTYGILGSRAKIVYCARTPWDTTSFGTYLDAMHAAGVRLIVHIFSAPASIAFISQLTAHPLKAVAAGIDVLGQLTEFWTWTGGTCQYEGFLASTGTRTPVSEVSEPYTTTEFWDLYLARFGHAPIYTSWGVYDGIIAMHDTLESAGIHPPLDKTKTDALIPIIEQTNREGILGKFKYTGPHPTVPGAMLHDIFSNEYGSTWTQRYQRAMWVQWQAGRLEVVWPIGVPFARWWALPSKMYPYPTDINQDATLDFGDISMVGLAYDSRPGDLRWQFVADSPTGDLHVAGRDHSDVCADQGKIVYPRPLPYCNEGGRLVYPP